MNFFKKEKKNVKNNFGSENLKKFMRDPHDMQVKSVTGISCKMKNEFFLKEKQKKC